jgi:hypothetical protein
MATTRQEALAAAFDKIESQPPAETPAEPPAVESQAADRARDEQGRFAKAQQTEAVKPTEAAPAPAVSAATQTPTTAPEPQATRKPPSSWKKDYWQHWDKLATDPELSKLQDYIEQREADFAKGVSTYKAQWDQAQPLMEAITPFMPELERFGIPPQQWIQNLGIAHRTLALGSPQEKLQMFAKLATDYGIPLQALQGQPNGQSGAVPQVDPQFGYIAQTVNALQNKLQQFETYQQQMEQARLLTEIEQFRATVDEDLFEAAKPVMAQLLESGMASDLKTAFEKAMRVEDSLWQRQQQAEQARQAEAAKAEADRRQREEQARVAHKRAAAVSPKSASPTGPATTGGGKQDRRSLIAQSFDEHIAGRF